MSCASLDVLQCLLNNMINQLFFQFFMFIASRSYTHKKLIDSLKFEEIIFVPMFSC